MIYLSYTKNSVSCPVKIHISLTNTAFLLEGFLCIDSYECVYVEMPLGITVDNKLNFKTVFVTCKQPSVYPTN
jgi:hypothetical protein